VEGFPQVAGKSPSPIVDITIGSKRRPSRQWNITIAASICLDFAHPTHDLHAKPSLILGPARTWHTNVGLVMMEMAKQRADELGTTVLWCDGGEGGLSGLVGQGYSGVQVGYGTWVQRLGFKVPLQVDRTVFGRFDALFGLILAWSLVILFRVAPGLEPIHPFRSQNPYIQRMTARVRSLFGRPAQIISQPNAHTLLDD
jgi:hypothetical protein